MEHIHKAVDDSDSSDDSETDAEMLRQRTPSSVQVVIKIGKELASRKGKDYTVMSDDLKATIQNLGDSLGIFKLVISWEGKSGIVFVEKNWGWAMKVFRHPVPFDQVASVLKVEGSVYYQNTHFRRKFPPGGRPRIPGDNDLIHEFAPYPFKSITGNKARTIALPSWTIENLYYPCLMTVAGKESLQTECIRVSHMMGDKGGKLPADAMLPLQ